MKPIEMYSWGFASEKDQEIPMNRAKQEAFMGNESVAERLERQKIPMTKAWIRNFMGTAIQMKLSFI
jgi:hypothetical protein